MQEILEMLHAGHIGIVTMKLLARSHNIIFMVAKKIEGMAQ